jgi:predicted DNA-binding antitoxin AbrB/MazE fold protein
MLNQEQPKKPRRRKNKRLNVTQKEKWERIIKDVEKREVPIHCLESITVNLKDGTKVHIDIRQLLAEGEDPERLENKINKKLYDLDEIISDVDFYISVENVAKTVQPITDILLKDL